MNKILTSFLILVILLTGCQSSKDQATDSDDVAEVFDDNSSLLEQADFTYGYADIDGDIKFTYDGEELNIPYYIENVGNTDLVMGLVVFVDGVPQKYAYNADDSKSYVKNVTIKPQEATNLSIYFTPSTGQQGETKGLYIGVIFNPDYKATVDSPVYGINQRISCLGGISIEFKKSVETVSLKTTEYKSENQDEEENEGVDSTFETDSESLDDLLITFTKSDISSVYYKEDDVFKIPFKMKGGSNCHYKVFAYIDNEVVQINGLDYLGVTMNESESFTYELMIDSELVNDSSSFYLIAIPDGDDYTSEYANLVQSDSILLVNENE